MIIGAAFIDERKLFGFLIGIETFIIQRGVKKITVITDNHTGNLKYPFTAVSLIDFKSWASSINNN